MNNVLEEYIPLWLAPNVITVSGMQHLTNMMETRESAMAMVMETGMDPLGLIMYCCTRSCFFSVGFDLNIIGEPESNGGTSRLVKSLCVLFSLHLSNTRQS